VLRSFQQQTKPFPLGKVLSYYRFFFPKPFVQAIYILMLSVFGTNALVAAEMDKIKHEVVSDSQCSIKKILKIQDGYYSEHFGKLFNSAINSEVYQLEDNKIFSYRFELIDINLHEKEIFTQGFVIENDYYYEVSGSLGSSKLYKFSTKTNQLQSKLKLPKNIFAEGIALVDDNIVLVSLKTGKGYFVSKNSLNIESTFQFSHDGWGIAYFEENLIISDGDSNLYWYSKDGKKRLGVKQVKVAGIALKGINEMEVVDDLIYANIWPTDCVAVIEPLQSKVIAWIDISKLNPWVERGHWSHVSNGLAYDRINQELWVTGKNWEHIYKLKIQKK